MVTLIARGSAEEVVLAVHNDGPPIPPEVQGTMFEPLVRHVSEAEVPTSLGLFIARAIAVSHGGTITVSSTASEGTTFTARLPRGADAPVREAVAPQ